MTEPVAGYEAFGSASVTAHATSAARVPAWQAQRSTRAGYLGPAKGKSVDDRVPRWRDQRACCLLSQKSNEFSRDAAAAKSIALRVRVRERPLSF